MTTECPQGRFEFHGPFQRKMKVRFDGGRITSDGGVLLLREAEKRTGLIAGLAECFSDRRDPLLAVAVEKTDPLGEHRRQASDRGNPLAGKCTLNVGAVVVIPCLEKHDDKASFGMIHATMLSSIRFPNRESTESEGWNRHLTFN